MEVKLKKDKTILDQIRDAQINAEEQNREIESITLDDVETLKLAWECNQNGLEPLGGLLGSRYAQAKPCSFYLFGTNIHYEPEGLD